MRDASRYTGDEFFGVAWCWDWGLREDLTRGLIDLGCYCPGCGARAPRSWIIPAEDGDVQSSGFDCPFCRRRVRIPLDSGRVESRVRDEIQIRLQTGAWKAAVRRARDRRRDSPAPRPRGGNTDPA